MDRICFTIESGVTNPDKRGYSSTRGASIGARAFASRSIADQLRDQNIYLPTNIQSTAVAKVVTERLERSTGLVTESTRAQETRTRACLAPCSSASPSWCSTWHRRSWRALTMIGKTNSIHEIMDRIWGVYHAWACVGAEIFGWLETRCRALCILLGSSHD